MASVPSSEVSHPAAAGAGAFGAAWARLVPSWPLWVGLVLFGRLLAQPFALLNDPDTYLHIAAGRWMTTHLAWPSADPFSHTMSGMPWVPGEWFAEAALAGIYAVAGWSGIVVIGAACFGIALGMLCHFLIRRIGALPGVIASLAGAALVLPHTVARPHLLAMPLLVLWSGMLFQARDEGRTPYWWLLPVMVLWANLHASFVFGLGLACWLGGEAVIEAASPLRRAVAIRWGAFIVGAVAAGLATPNGIDAFLQPLRLMTMPALQSSFGEWLAPDFADFPVLEGWLLAVLALGLGLRLRVRWTRLLLLLVLVHMALRHVRHADLLGLIGPLVIAAALGEALMTHAATLSGLTLWRAAARLAGPVRLPAFGVTLALAAIASLPLMTSPLMRTDDAVTPARALVAARDLGLTGPVFNGEGFGGYLAFAGIADFIDGRVEMFGNDFLADDVAAEGGDPAVLARLLTQYRIAWTLLAPQAGAVAVLDRLPGWRRAYADPYAVIHVHTAIGGH